MFDSNTEVDVFGLAGEFQLGAYSDITGPIHKGDMLSGHELLQSAWLKQNHNIGRSSSIGKQNPSIALTEPNMQKNISKLQQKYKLGGTNLKGQSALQNINRNTALTRKGIYQGLLHRGWEPTNAKRYATQLSMQLRENALEFAKKNGFLNTH